MQKHRCTINGREIAIPPMTASFRKRLIKMHIHPSFLSKKVKSANIRPKKFCGGSETAAMVADYTYRSSYVATLTNSDLTHRNVKRVLDVERMKTLGLPPKDTYKKYRQAGVPVPLTQITVVDEKKDAVFAYRERAYPLSTVLINKDGSINTRNVKIVKAHLIAMVRRALKNGMRFDFTQTEEPNKVHNFGIRFKKVDGTRFQVLLTDIFHAYSSKDTIEWLEEQRAILYVDDLVEKIEKNVSRGIETLPYECANPKTKQNNVNYQLL
jgi:hypothetical protein